MVDPQDHMGRGTPCVTHITRSRGHTDLPATRDSQADGSWVFWVRVGVGMGSVAGGRGWDRTVTATSLALICSTALI